MQACASSIARAFGDNRGARTFVNERGAGGGSGGELRAAHGCALLDLASFCRITILGENLRTMVEVSGGYAACMRAQARENNRTAFPEKPSIGAN